MEDLGPGRSLISNMCIQLFQRKTHPFSTNDAKFLKRSNISPQNDAKWRKNWKCNFMIFLHRVTTRHICPQNLVFSTWKDKLLQHMGVGFLLEQLYHAWTWKSQTHKVQLVILKFHTLSIPIQKNVYLPIQIKRH